MPVALRFPRGTMKPPLGAFIDMDHPFSHGLVISALFNEFGSYKTDSVIGPYVDTINVFTANGSAYRLGEAADGTGTVSWGSNREGSCLSFHSTAANVGLGPSTGFPADAVTVAIVRRKKDTTSRNSYLFNLGSAGANTLINIHAPWGDGTVYWAFRNNSQEFAVPGLTHTTGIERWVFTAGPAGQTVWRNGVKVGNNTTPMVARALSTSTIRIGNSGADLEEVNSVHAVGVQWSDNLCRWWSAEPYAQFYSPLAARRYFYFDSAGSGPVPPVNDFTIDGVSRDILQPWSISEALNERGTMRFGVKSMDGSYRPGLREIVDFTWDDRHYFAGHIHHTEEAGLGGYGVVPIVTQCGATDFNALPDRRQLAITLPAGTLKSMLELLEPYLTDYGVTLDPAQVNGPTLVELTFTIGSLTAILDKLSVVSEYAWNIDYDKVLSMFAPGTEAAPFDIEDDDARVVGDVRVSPTTVDYANRIIVLAGTGTQDVSDPVGVGDGVEDTFELNYNVASLYGYVTNDVTNETLRVVGDPDAATWEYNPATNSITRLTGAPGVGDAITIPYTAQFPFEVIAEDVPAQDGGANLIERVYSHPEVFDAVTAQALADGYLVRSLVQPREIRYRTRLHGLHPGMQQQIQVTTRNVDGPCLITAVDISPEGSALYNYDITAVEGLTIVPSYQEAWRTLAGVSGN